MFKSGLKDILTSLKNIKLALYLASSDIRQRYRRSTLGPFWITISTSFMIGSMGLIFGSIFKTPLEIFLPFLAVGLITWGFINTTLMEATSVFPSAEAVIKQLPLPLFLHVLRMLFRNLIIYFHNLIIIPLVIFFLSSPINLDLLFFIPGLILLVINLAWCSLLLGTLCARFRDVSLIIGSVLQIIFYVSPIIWMPSMLPAKADIMVLDANPIFHLLELTRLPWLGQSPSVNNWIVCVLLAIFGWSFTICVFNKYRDRVSYWV